MPYITLNIDLSDIPLHHLIEEVESHGKVVKNGWTESNPAPVEDIPEELWDWLRLHGTEVPVQVRDWAYSIKGVIV